MGTRFPNIRFLIRKPQTKKGKRLLLSNLVLGSRVWDSGFWASLGDQDAVM